MAKRVKISVRAAIQRINRKLKPKGRVLKTARTEQAEDDYGRYYVIDLRRNGVVDMHVNLDDIGSELYVLADWEEVANE